MYVTDGNQTMILSLEKGYVRRKDFEEGTGQSYQLVCVIQFVPYGEGEKLDLLRFFSGGSYSLTGTDESLSTREEALIAANAVWADFEDWVLNNGRGENLFFFSVERQS